jgi:hypothetical protein
VNSFKRLACVATIAALGAAASPAWASPATSANYTINLPDFAVTDIVVADMGSPFTVFTQGAPGKPIGAAIGTSTISTDFLTADEIGIPGFVYTPGQVFLLGVTSDLPGDADGQKHLVVFTNDAFAQSAQNIAFGTLFPEVDEDTLINDLITSDNIGDISDFAVKYAVNAGPNGSIAFNIGDHFTAVAFSDGQIIGTGTSVLIGGVPEPEAWALMVLGFGGVGAALRTRRRPVPAAA